MSASSRQTPAAEARRCHEQAGTRLRAGDIGGAARLLDEAIAHDPGFALAWSDRATLRLRAGDAAGAVADLERALALAPQTATLWIELGLAHDAGGDAAAALAAFEQACALDPSLATAHYNCGVIQHRLGDLDAAVRSNRRAIALPNPPLMAWSNLGIALEQRGEAEAARAAYDEAIARAPNDPSAYWNKAQLELRSGDHAAGWKLYEWRWAAGKAGVPQRRYPGRPLWLGGAPLEGRTILLHPEQGLGDIIQFARFAPLLTARGAQVILEVFTPLKPLFAGMEGVAKVIGSGEPPPPFDLHCPLLSLPLALGITGETLLRETPYVTPDPARAAAWRARLGPATRPRIGFVWKGNPKFPNDANRSVPLADFATLFGADAEFLSLQKEVTEDERRLLASHANVRQMGPALEDFGETAAILANCDAAIVIDTSVAHLAGALAIPAALLLPARADWRWMQNPTETPWYPTLRLYRQPTPADWTQPLAGARTFLETLAGGETAG